MKCTIIVLSMVALFASCQKDSPNPPQCSISMANLAGTYKLTALTYKLSGGSAESDMFAGMDDCEKDNLVTLKTDGTYIYKDAGIVCTPNGDNSGTWQLNGQTLTSDGVLNGTVSSFNCKTLVYYVKDIIVTGDKYTFTMVKQ